MGTWDKPFSSFPLSFWSPRTAIGSYGLAFVRRSVRPFDRSQNLFRGIFLFFVQVSVFLMQRKWNSRILAVLALFCKNWLFPAKNQRFVIFFKNSVEGPSEYAGYLWNNSVNVSKKSCFGRFCDSLVKNQSVDEFMGLGFYDNFCWINIIYGSWKKKELILTNFWICL